MNDNFVIKGDICHSLSPSALECVADGYVVCEAGRSAGVFRELPERYAALPVEDCTGRLVLPGLTDLHVHAAQFAYRGTGMDCELLDWLERYAFPEEARFADMATPTPRTSASWRTCGEGRIPGPVSSPRRTPRQRCCSWISSMPPASRPWWAG